MWPQASLQCGRIWYYWPSGWIGAGIFQSVQRLSYGLDDQGSIPGGGNNGILFLSATASRPSLGPTQPPIQCLPGDLSLGVRRPGCEADHSTQCNAEVKNGWSYTSTPQYVFTAWYLNTVTILPVIRQTRPPVREDAPWQQYQSCLNYSQNLVMSPRGAQCQDGLTASRKVTQNQDGTDNCITVNGGMKRWGTETFWKWFASCFM